MKTFPGTSNTAQNAFTFSPPPHPPPDYVQSSSHFLASAAPTPVPQVPPVYAANYNPSFPPPQNPVNLNLGEAAAAVMSAMFYKVNLATFICNGRSFEGDYTANLTPFMSQIEFNNIKSRLNQSVYTGYSGFIYFILLFLGLGGVVAGVALQILRVYDYYDVGSFYIFPLLMTVGTLLIAVGAIYRNFHIRKALRQISVEAQNLTASYATRRIYIELGARELGLSPRGINLSRYCVNITTLNPLQQQSVHIV